ncbi:MAG: hypothetical protein QOF58_6200 [Pseudonocardiales bacterium]|nr:hypothetical protein [Pseudonocardiales bacterium]
MVTGTYRWGLLFRTLWLAAFTPILIGLLVAGIVGHWVFLLAFVIWLGALACVLRAEALNARARSQEAPAPGLLAARAGWGLLALVLIFGSAGLIRAVLGD